MAAQGAHLEWFVNMKINPTTLRFCRIKKSQRQLCVCAVLVKVIFNNFSVIL